MASTIRGAASAPNSEDGSLALRVQPNVDYYNYTVYLQRFAVHAPAAARVAPAAAALARECSRLGVAPPPWSLGLHTPAIGKVSPPSQCRAAPHTRRATVAYPRRCPRSRPRTCA